MSLFFELVDSKITRILSLLLKNPKEHYHIQKLSRDARVPLSSTFRIVNKLVRLNLIETTTIGKFKIYKLNEKRSTELKELLGENK